MRKIAALIFIILFYQPLAHGNVSLTASDGSGLEMKSFKAKVVLEGLFAFTEIEMIFHNPQNRQREGRFQIVLPQGAAISRFAMSRGNQLLEGEVVERKLAQQAYEDFLHRRQDPALLEVDQGNRFNARVFPIVANEYKRIIVSYSQTLTSGYYLLPLKGLPKVEQFSLRVTYDSNYSSTNQVQATDISGLKAQLSSLQLIKVDRSNHKPEQDFIMPLAGPKDTLAVRAGSIVATRLVPFAKSKQTQLPKPENWTVLIDTSASQALYLDKTLEKLKSLRAGLSPSRWQVFSFDQVFRRHKNLTEVTPSLALGASNLERAIKQLENQQIDASRLLIVSDVVVTAGQTNAKKLGELLRNVKGITRVDVLLPSSHYDYPLANTLRHSANEAGVVTDLKLDTVTLVHKLLTTNYANVAVDVLGSKWYWPKTINAIQAGEAVTVFAELDPTRPIHLKIANKIFTPQAQAQETETALLKREWARARVDRLSALMQDAADPDMGAALLQQIIKISVDERIITPYTALLVLESAADYQRYNIKPQAMADILTIGMEGITVVNRSHTLQFIPDQQRKLETNTISNGIDEQNDSKDKVVTENKSSEQFLAKKSQPSLSLSAPERPPAPRVQTNQSMGNTAAPTEPLAEEAPLTAPAETTVDEEISNQEFRQQPLADGAMSDGVISGNISREAPPVSRRIASGNREKQKQLSPWTGEYKTFRNLLSQGRLESAHEKVTSWRQSQPQDVMALIALGEYFESVRDFQQASRAYGSLIDYFPARADIRRWAAGRLLGFEAGYELALDSLTKAVAQRPDHPSGHYLLAWAYWLNGEIDSAKATLRKAMHGKFPRFAGSHRILKECLELMSEKIKQSQLRFVLTWETDANDVDFHVRDNKNNHAYYSHPSLPTGGRLYYDITTGYGPENFTINNPKNFPYKLSAHYYSMGPMGYGMGVLNIVRYDGDTGKIKLEFRPFVVMTDQAFVDLGKVEKY